MRNLVFFYAAIIALSIVPHLQADDTPAVKVALPDGTVGTLAFSSRPTLAMCGDAVSDGNRTSWQCSDYKLDIAVNSVQGGYILAFQVSRSDGTAFELNTYSIRVAAPYSQDDAIWSYNRHAVHDILETDLESPVTYNTTPNFGIPFVALVNGSGVNQLSVGLVSQTHGVSIEGSLSQDASEYTFSIKQLDANQTSMYGDAFYISTAQSSWYNQAKTYSSAVDDMNGYTPLNIPPSAYNSTFDSWYWTFDIINQDLVWQLAQASHALGFKSYLFDSGWDTAAGELTRGLNGSTGDYYPPPSEFPDFQGLLDSIRNQLGMKVMLWMQQYALGRDSIYYPQLADSLSSILDDNGDLQQTEALCPRVANTGRHMQDLLGRIMNDYHPDALWFDWQDYIPSNCSATHNHDFASFGEGYNGTQQIILDTVRQHNPDTFMEIRWPFANLNNKQFVQLWQPDDSPGDSEEMRLGAMNMRPFSSGIVMGTDEMYWDPAISDEEAARFMSTVVFTGVPYFGPNLPALSQSQNEMLSAWLKFYEGHRKDLVSGEFSPYGNPNHPDQIIEGAKETFIYYGNRYPSVSLTKPDNRIYVVNASQSPTIDLMLSGLEEGVYTALISDLHLNNFEVKRFSAFENNIRLSVDLPVGGVLALSRVRVKSGLIM